MDIRDKIAPGSNKIRKRLNHAQLIHINLGKYLKIFDNGLSECQRGVQVLDELSQVYNLSRASPRFNN